MFRKTVSSQTLRRVALLLLVMIAAPLAISGIGASRIGKPAGKIFGKAVSQNEFQQQRTWVLNQLGAQLGEASDSLDALGAFVDQSVWDRLMLLEEARRGRIRVTDGELAGFIRQIGSFQKDGRFDPKLYRGYLEMIGVSPQDFEQWLRQDMILQKLGETVKASISVTDDDVRAAYREKYEQLTAVVIFFDNAAFTAEAEAAATEAAVRAGFEAGAEAFRVPEKITFAYAGNTRAEAVASVEPPDDAALEAFYEERRDAWPAADGKPKPLTEVREDVRQRFISEAARKRLTALSLDLQDDLDAKKPFDEIVATRNLTQQSFGPVSPAELWSAGAPEPALMQAAAALAEGETSGSIQTDEGVHIVKLLKREASRIPPYEEVREEARQRFVKRRAKELASERAGELHAYLKEKLDAGVRYEEAALSYEGNIPASTFTFTRSGGIGPLGRVPVANEAAFETPAGSITGVIEAPNGFAILRPEGRIEADFSHFAQEEADLRKETQARRESARFNQWLADVRARGKLKMETPSRES